MAFTSRKLLPPFPTYYSYSSPPSPSPSPSNAISCPSDPYCSWPYTSPPPPPPAPLLLPHPNNPSPPSRRSPLLSTHGILAFSLAFSLISSLFLLTVYFILLTRSRRNRSPRQGPPPQPEDGGQQGQGEEWNQNLAMVHPIWLINTVGLQPAVICSIAVCEYKKGEGLIEGDQCLICLSDFEEGESLRLLPKCSHAFHIPCIDTWLRSHTNCPLCRAPIMAPAPASSSVATLEPTGSGSGGREDLGENTDDGDSSGDDTGGSGGGVEGGNGEEGLNDKSVAEEVEVGASVGRRSVSVDGIASAILNLDREGNQRGWVGGVRSLPGSRRFCRPGSHS